MALQGRRQGWKSYGASGVPERDENFLPARNFIHGPDEGMSAPMSVELAHADKYVR